MIDKKGLEERLIALEAANPGIRAWSGGLRCCCARARIRRGDSMAARGSGGLLLCLGLLLAMPVLAATPADRSECAASADKPDVGGAACSRVIDDASEQAAERVKAFKNRGRGSFNG
jgi:hypothetical protein